MTLREFVDREQRANPELVHVYRAFETAILECDYGRAEHGATDLMCDRDAPPRYWQSVIIGMDQTRQASGMPPLGE